MLPLSHVVMARALLRRSTCSGSQRIYVPSHAELALLCTSEGRAKSSALLIEGAQQIAELASGDERLGYRGVTRVRVTGVSIRGAWAQGLVLRSTHLAEARALYAAALAFFEMYCLLSRPCHLPRHTDAQMPCLTN